MPKSVWQQIAAWQGRHPVLHHAAVQGTTNRRTLVWETVAHNGVAVIEKVGDAKRGAFVGVKFYDKPFKRVVGIIKRSHTLDRKRHELEGRLC